MAGATGLIDYDNGGAGEHASVLDAVRRFWWVFLGIVGLFVLLGLLSTAGGEETYRASAELIITDARANRPFTVTDLGAPSNQPSERYLADQVEILRSTTIAREAARKLSGDLDTRTVLERRGVTGDLTSNTIEITYEGQTANDARRGADALAQAYIDIREAQFAEAAAEVTSQYDDLVEILDQSLEDIQSQIDEVEDENTERRDAFRRIQAAVGELQNLRNRRDSAPLDGDERAAVNQQIEELTSELAAWELIVRVEPQSSELSALLAEREALIAERARLSSQRNSIAADLQNIDVGVEFFSPALLPEEPVGLNTQLVVVIFVAVGAALGAAVAYGLGLRRRDFTDELQPETILEAPMIGEIPSAEEVGSGSLLPTATHPDSRSAEAYRFVALAISTQQERAEAVGEEAATIVGVAAGSPSDGAGVIAANVALAYAEQGRRVLVVDADFERRAATRALVADRMPTLGISDVLQDGMLPANAVVRVDSSRKHAVDLLGRGMTHDPPAMVFSDERLAREFSRLTEGYDLVIVACPPLLEVAYSRRVLDLTDAALAVIGHGTSVSSARRFRDQLLAAGAPVVGYVYNRFNAAGSRPRRRPDQSEQEAPLEQATRAAR